MRINTNLMALNTHRQLSINTNNVSKSTEKLSSGLRINRAGDDAAGLAISEKMRAQIKGLTMASKNSQDAISLVQTAEGALTETHAILQRMRELAVQSSSDTNETVVDRGALQAEFTALRSEIDEIAANTQFNNKTLLDGGIGLTTAVDATSTIDVGDFGINSIVIDGFAAGNDHTVAFALTGGTPGAAYEVTFGSVTIGGVVNETTAGNISLDFGGGKTISITYTDTMQVDDLDGMNLIFDVTGAAAKIQTGANENETLDIAISSMDSTDLTLVSGALDTASVATGTAAESAITVVNEAINTVSTQRAKLGAIQNRLEHKIKNLDTSAENLSSAESRIRDLDMASEMTAFTSSNILVQAATAMLAQANSAPQNVLQLLK